MADGRGPYLKPGTRVILDASDKDHLEHGVVIYCWYDEKMDAHDCHVAFYGRKWPEEQPETHPYILRYYTTSLHVVDQPAAEASGNIPQDAATS
jgi:hypothetical protein